MNVTGDSVSDDFDALSLIRDVQRELGTGDRHAIAKEALQRTPPDQYASALLQAYAEMGRHVVVAGHPRMGNVPDAAASVRSAVPGRVNSARSQKVAAIRRAWPELRAVYACLDPQKQFGDYGAADLLFVAEYLETQGRRSLAKASRFRALADLVTGSGVAAVRDLPDDVLAAVFTGGEAA